MKPHRGHDSRPVLVFVLGALVWASVHALGQASLTTTLDAAASSFVLPLPVLLAFRVTAAALVGAVAGGVVLDPIGLFIDTKYFPGSSLKAKRVHIKGLSRLTTFTVWSWCLIGVYFTVASAASTMALCGISLSESSARPWWAVAGLALSWGLMQVAFSASVFVTVIVTFVLLPMITKSGIKTDIMMSPRALLMHNANVILMMTELLFGRHTVEVRHVGLTVLWGATYVLFAWYWQRRTGIYFYPFLDHTLVWWKACGCHLGLVAALCLFHAIGAAASAALRTGGAPFLYVAVAAYGCVGFILRLR